MSVAHSIVLDCTWSASKEHAAGYLLLRLAWWEKLETVREAARTSLQHPLTAQAGCFWRSERREEKRREEKRGTEVETELGKYGRSFEGRVRGTRRSVY